ncbi:MAG: YkgJ family cysteine cluster protein, partial [Planctomycetes bacterium]|nr:YkgJ family cysteine cluster protein [Planctomycetota bacterium]
PLLAAGPDSPERACRAGCAHCCHFPVGVTFAEALLLHRTLAAEPVQHAAVLANARADADRPWLDLVGRPCPLLVAGHCSTYDSRPLPCRALASSDEAACASALRGTGTAPRDEVAFWRGLGAASVLAEGQLGPSRELRSVLCALADAAGRDGDLDLDLTTAAAAFACARTAGGD